MYLRDVITQLRSELPKYSTKFSERVAISSLSYAGGIVTVVTATDHGLETGDITSIVDAKQRTPITSITEADGVATVTTTIDHDLTTDYHDQDDQPDIEISGVTVGAYNGDWSLSDVTSRRIFTFEISGSPIDANDGYLLEPSPGGYSGLKEITKINDTTFTFTTSKTLATEGQRGYAHTNLRLTRSVTIDRFIEAYSKQLADDWWGVVVPENVQAAKNRHIFSDPTDMPTNGDEYRQKLIDNFSLYIIVPSKNDIAGGASYDEIIEESVGIFKALVGATLNSPYSISSFTKVIFEGHQFYTFLKAFYVHQFQFSVTDEIVNDDISTVEIDVAFRDLDYDIINENDEVIMENSIELDN